MIDLMWITGMLLAFLGAAERMVWLICVGVGILIATVWVAIRG